MAEYCAPSRDHRKYQGRTSLANARSLRYCFTFSIAVLCYSIGITTPIFAQQDAKIAAQKWRPKDGPYGLDPGTDPNVSCEMLTLHDIELGRRLIVSDEMYKCEIVKITDTAPATLRLDAKCDYVKKRKSRDTIFLHKIDDQSFFMGWRGQRQFRYISCPENGMDKIMAKAKRRKMQEQIGRQAWRPRDGVYAKPETSFEDRCMKSGDATIDLAEISISNGISHCEVDQVEGGAQNSISLQARCDLKPGETGMVARSIGGGIVFAPVGTEKIVITNAGNQTISLQKSRNGEFSELPELFAYCPDAAQRAYADSKKVK